MKSKQKTMMVEKSLCLIGLSATLIFISIEKANAYIDPGSLSAVFQGIIAALAAGLVYLKIYWENVRSIFAKLAKKTVRKKRSK